jgi:cysteine desulfurase / selenocysteine lyase
MTLQSIGLRARADFPILKTEVQGHPLVYLDNAATTQKPEMVLRAMNEFYEHDNANVHRGVHELSERATEAYENARATVAAFIHAASPKEIIFVRGTTEAINCVAQTYGRAFLKAGDEILISAMEHHSNIVPWQMVCEQTGAHLKVISITEQGEIDLAACERLINSKTRLVALVHISNALGTVNPVREVIRLAHAAGVPVLLDGAQAISHFPVDVQALDCDFYAFSGHKCYGPMGIGVLYGKEKWLSKIPPYQGGGEMIREVTFEKTTYQNIPHKFEAGTPNVGGAVGLAAALRYLQSYGLADVAAYESDLLSDAAEKLSTVPGLRFIGNATHKAGLHSFVLKDIHPHDVGTILNSEGIAVRAGHHCAMPVMNFFKVPATTRVSFALYNTPAEIDACVAALHKTIELFS